MATPSTSKQKELADKPAFWVFIGGLSMFGVALAVFLVYYLFFIAPTPKLTAPDVIDLAPAPKTKMASDPIIEAFNAPAATGKPVPKNAYDAISTLLPEADMGFTASAKDKNATPTDGADSALAQTTQAVVRVIISDDQYKHTKFGSGFFVSRDGLLVTNLHVIRDAKHALVKFPNGVEFAVLEIKGVDEPNDLVLLRVDTKPKVFLSITAVAPPKVGTKVFAIGNPEGLTNTVSEGVVSAVHRDDLGVNAIQTTAPISPGSSGGPLIAVDGSLVGVTTFYSKEGQNLNFAVPAQRVAEMLEKWRRPPARLTDTEMLILTSIKPDWWYGDSLISYGDHPEPPSDRTLQMAAFNDDVQSIQTMLNGGADINTGRGKYDWTPLHWAAWKGNEQAISVLVKRGAALGPPDMSGMTPLHLAAMQGHAVAAKTLILAGAPVDLPNKWGDTPLDTAAQNGRAVVASLLLDKGADPNSKDMYGDTPLHGAVYHPDIVFMLLERKAEPNIKDKSGETPLARAQRLQADPSFPESKPIWAESIKILSRTTKPGGFVTPKADAKLYEQQRKAPPAP